MVQVLNNLLSNAAEHSCRWSAVTVAEAMHDHHVAISVTDQGASIAAESLWRLFTAFPHARGAAQRHASAASACAFAVRKGIPDKTVQVPQRSDPSTEVMEPLQARGGG